MKVDAIVFENGSDKSRKRLFAAFSPEQSKLLSAAMLEDVLTALKSSVVHEVVVVGTDSDVRGVVEKCGVSFVQIERAGLNLALKKAIASCMEKKSDAVLMLPVNIPLVSSSDIDRMVALGSQESSLVLCPSMKGGTNAVLLNPPDVVQAQFGRGSFFKLVKAAIDKDVALKFYSSRETAFDMDSEEDLGKLLEIKNNTASKRIFEEIRPK